MKILVPVLVVSAGGLAADGAGPVAGVDGIRRYSYTERLTRITADSYAWGLDADTFFSNTNRSELTLGADWTLEHGGSRRFVERTFWETWDAQGCGDGREFHDQYATHIATFGPWNAESSVSYRTYTRTWIRPCLPTDLQGTTSPTVPDAGINTFAGEWIQRRETNHPPANSWSIAPPFWEQGYNRFQETWNQTPRVQLTTGTSPFKTAGSFFWIRPTAYDLDRHEPIPNSEIRVAGARVTKEGRALVYSLNNAGYNQMRDVTPSIPTRKSFQFSVDQVRGDLRTGAVNWVAARPNPAWPGARPSGMAQRMQYPSGATPGDDQVLWDVLSNSPLAPQLASAANAVLALSPPAVSVSASGGVLTQTGVADRQWLTLAFLSRTANEVPPQTLTTNELDQCVVNARSTFRLINEFRVMTVPDGQQFAVADTERRRAALGQTAVTLLSGVSVRVRRSDGTLQTLPIGLSQANQILQMAGVGSTAVASGNGVVTGGVGSSEVRATAAMQGGVLPAAVHDLIVRGPRRDVSTSVGFQASADQVWLSPAPNSCAWPASSTYVWQESDERYVKAAADPAVTPPFDCFLTIHP